MGMRVRVTQTWPAIVNGNPVILPGLRPVTAIAITSIDDATHLIQHPCLVTLTYINNNPMSCFYKNCETLIGTEKIWGDEDLMCGNTMYKLNVMTKEEKK